MQLREQIARETARASGYDWLDLSNRGGCRKWLRIADAILSIPELKEALEHKALIDDALHRHG